MRVSKAATTGVALLALLACDSILLDDGILEPEIPTVAGALNGVCDGDVLLRTQADLAAFACPVVSGNLEVFGRGGTITDLSGLSMLTGVGKNLTIYETDVLDLDGLSSLASVGGDAFIHDNYDLLQVDGLSALISVGGTLTFWANTAMIDVDGLSSLTSVGGGLQFQDSYALENVDGLSSLGSIGGFIFLAWNDVLTDLDGLSSVDSIGSWIWLLSNNALNNLDGLASLSQIPGTVDITGNGSLSDVDGLSAVTSIGGFLKINRNHSLSDLDGLSSLTTIGGQLEISGNGSLIDLGSLSSLASVWGDLTVQGNSVLGGCGCALKRLLESGGVGGEVVIQENAEGCNSVGEVLAQQCDEQGRPPPAGLIAGLAEPAFVEVCKTFAAGAPDTEAAQFRIKAEVRQAGDWQQVDDYQITLPSGACQDVWFNLADTPTRITVEEETSSLYGPSCENTQVGGTERTSPCGQPSQSRVLVKADIGHLIHFTNTPLPPAFSCSLVTEVASGDCRALEVLYHATGGGDWVINGHWLDTNAPCSWWGVSCADGRIVDVGLGSNNLIGRLPPEIGNLTALRRLDLSDNLLLGGLPPEMGNLRALESFDLGSNRLTGLIPPELGRLNRLRGFNLGNNFLIGLIPPELGNIGHSGSDVVGVGLDSNRLAGPIPSTFSRFVNVQEFELLLNQDLAGIVPLVVANVGSRLPGNVPLVGIPPDPARGAANCTFKETDLLVPDLPGFREMAGRTPTSSDICGLTLTDNASEIIATNIKAIRELARFSALASEDRDLLVASLELARLRLEAGQTTEAWAELGRFSSAVTGISDRGALHPAYAHTIRGGAEAARDLLETAGAPPGP